MAASKLSLKLLIDTKARRVLFAEADKKTVDFLFGILTLPISTVINLLTKKQMVGCVANLYDSVENLNQSYIQSSQTKDTLLKPKTLVHDQTNFLKPLFALPSDVNVMKQKNEVSYTCRDWWMNGYCGTEDTITDFSSDCYCDYHCDYDCCHHRRKTYKRSDQKLYFSDEIGAKCPKCNRVMSMEMSYVVPTAATGVKRTEQRDEVQAGEEGKGGFVMDVVTYLVMDDLVVKPMPTLSSIALLNTLNVGDIGSLEEKVVDLGIHEALELLKTSLASKEVLTTVFMKNEISK